MSAAILSAITTNPTLWLGNGGIMTVEQKVKLHARQGGVCRACKRELEVPDSTPDFIVGSRRPGWLQQLAAVVQRLQHSHGEEP